MKDFVKEVFYVHLVEHRIVIKNDLQVKRVFFYI